MSSANAQTGLRFEVAEHSVGHVMEFVAFVFPPEGAFVVGWPAAPGEARHDAAGHPVLLHFAPARWLAPAPSPEIAALIASAAQSFAGTPVDVSGKWRELRLSGPDATYALSLSIDSEAVLEGRECASVTLFDCPCVLARTVDGYVIWVRASFAVDLAAVFSRLRAPE